MDLTFKALGHYGRLGNQLFQIASTIGIAIKNGGDYYFPHSWRDPDPNQLGATHHSTPWAYQNLFVSPLPTSDKDIEFLHDEGAYCDYQDILLPENKSCVLHGYYQSYKYFSHCEDIVRYYLTPKEAYLKYLLYRYPILLTDHFTALHFRRGDYKTLKEVYCQLDEPPLVEYYHQATDHLNAKNLMIFSDDISYMKENMPNPSGRIIFIDMAHDLLSLFLMSLCKDHIIANSSLSWWGAWLSASPDKRVVAPRNWYTPQHLKQNYHSPETVMENLIPETWTLL